MASLYAFKLIQLTPRLYLHLMNPGRIASALRYASIASGLRPLFARVAPSLFHTEASFGEACNAVLKQSIPLEQSPDILNNTPRPT